MNLQHPTTVETIAVLAGALVIGLMLGWLLTWLLGVQPARRRADTLRLEQKLDADTYEERIGELMRDLQEALGRATMARFEARAKETELAETREALEMSRLLLAGERGWMDRKRTAEAAVRRRLERELAEARALNAEMLAALKAQEASERHGATLHDPLWSRKEWNAHHAESARLADEAQRLRTAVLGKAGGREVQQ